MSPESYSQLGPPNPVKTFNGLFSTGDFRRYCHIALADNAVQERRKPLEPRLDSNWKPDLFTSWLACSAGTTGFCRFLSRKGLHGRHYEWYRSSQVVLAL